MNSRSSQQGMVLDCMSTPKLQPLRGKQNTTEAGQGSVTRCSLRHMPRHTASSQHHKLALSSPIFGVALRIILAQASTQQTCSCSLQSQLMAKKPIPRSPSLVTVVLHLASKQSQGLLTCRHWESRHTADPSQSACSPS